MSLRRWFLLPVAALLLLFFVAPFLIVLVYSFLSRGAYGGVELPYSLDSYARLFDRLYLEIILRSVRVSALSTLLCLVIAFPLAQYIAKAGKHRKLLLHLVMIPFWTSFLIRTYAWMFLLRDTGLINSALISLHVIARPLPLLFNEGAVVLGLVYGYLPFMVLPLYATLEKLDESLPNAAQDLGATPWTTFWKIIVPLSRNGIAAGCVLVFIPCLGAYLTPDLLGGGRTVMIGNLVQNQFTTARDWPFGSAASLLLTVVAFVVMLSFTRGRSEDAF